MKKWKLPVRIAAMLLASLCIVSGASAEGACYDTSDNGGKPRTDIEAGRSDTFGFDPVSYEELRELFTGSRNTSDSGGTDRGPSSSSGDSTCPPTGSGSSSTSSGSSTICPPTSSGSSSTGNNACPPVRDDCDTDDADCEPTPSETKTPSKDDGGSDDHYTPGSLTSQERYLLDSLNEERTSRGLSALPVDMELTELARTKSADMVDNKYFAHESPTYGRASDMLDDADYDYTSVSENIARSGSVEKAHAALMSSSGHRAAILGSQWKKVGIGVVNDANGYPYITQLFVR